MTPDDATIRTKQQIEDLKKQIEEATDPKVKRQLQSQLKELQILQLWRISQAWDKGDWSSQ